MRLGLAMVASAVALLAQSGRSYGPDRVWWSAGRGGILPWEETYDNPDGQLTIVNKNGAVHTEDHPFFEPLGDNGRACITCHQPSNAMGVSAAALRDRWNDTQGKDPVFAAIDGSNCPDLPQGARASHSLLLDRGLIRIALPWPPRTLAGRVIQPDFRIEVVRDPTGCNASPVYGLHSQSPAISVYRRPRITANLEYVVAGPHGPNFMADARESSLRSQAITAVIVHEQAKTHPSPEQLRQILDFETQVYVAQSADIRGGLLNEKDGPLLLGPQNLAAGVSAGLGAQPDSPAVLSFAAWRKMAREGDLGLQREFRASVVRGSDLFFNRAFRDKDGVRMTCSACHRPGEQRWRDAGTTNQLTARNSPDLPLFRVVCNEGAPTNPRLGREIYTQDPGRALISGKCADTGAVVVPQLRGLAARAPYFSNGSAQTLAEVVEFYDRRFSIGLTEQERQDLTNFLRVL